MSNSVENFYTEDTSQTGQIWDLNEQCKTIYGRDASFCHVFFYFNVFIKKNKKLNFLVYKRSTLLETFL